MTSPTAAPDLRIDDPALTDLRRAPFDGEIIRPADPTYDAARRPWNAMVDKRPALIVRPRGASDVAAAVRFATTHGVEIAVRCGGHGASGTSSTEGGLLIDLGLMRGVRVDPDPTRPRAWVQGGALLADVDRETSVHGLATTGGVISHTGVGGLTLGGGYGYLGRRFGLACDNVRSAEVVLATGDIVTASPSSHPDLYWAIRGGGGNFGIVTSFEFELHAFGPDILSVDHVFDADDGSRALRAMLEVAAEAPDAFGAGGTVATARVGGPLPEAMHGRTVVVVSATYADDIETGRQVVGRLTARLPTPVARFEEVVRYVDLQCGGDEVQRHGQRQYVRSAFFRATPDALIDAMLDRAGADPAVAPAMNLDQLGGAIGRVGPDDTAFSGRDAAYDLVIGSTWQDPADDGARLTAARACGASVEPLATGRSYVNAIDADDRTAVAATAAGGDPVRAAFGTERYDRLAAIKARYDPSNVFHLNQNVRPAAVPSGDAQAR